jgi:RNA-binding protein
MNLEPAVQIGRQGATENAVKEVQLALLRTELVKVRVNAGERDARTALMEEIAAKTDSVLCGATGSSALYYRPSDKHLIKLG